MIWSTFGQCGKSFSERRTSINYQVAWNLSTEETVEREFGALAKIHDNYPKFVLTTDGFTQNRDGIVHSNVFQWLLNDE